MHNRISRSAGKIAVTAFIFVNLLFFLLVMVNLIPNSAVYKNLRKSAESYRNIGNLAEDGVEPGAGFNELNIIMHVDSRHPVYSTLMDPIYGETGKFQDDKNGYESIVNKLEADNDYSRYWHGYQIMWRPLLLFMSTEGILKFMMVVYLVLLVLFVLYLYRQKDGWFAAGFVLMHVYYIIPGGFRALEYIPLFFVMLASLFLLARGKTEPGLIFCLTGIATSFFDFLTTETLALTVPLLYIICRQVREKNLKAASCIRYSLLWLGGYGFTYVYKWLLTTVIYRKNFFETAFKEITKYKAYFGRMMSVKININALFHAAASYNATFYIMTTAVVVLLITLYLFRKSGTEKCLICIAAVCMIPYIRYIILAGHSWEHAYFTYRAQLVLIPALVMLLKIGFGSQYGEGGQTGAHAAVMLFARKIRQTVCKIYARYCGIDSVLQRRKDNRKSNQ